MEKCPFCKNSSFYLRSFDKGAPFTTKIRRMNLFLIPYPALIHLPWGLSSVNKCKIVNLPLKDWFLPVVIAVFTRGYVSQLPPLHVFTGASWTKINIINTVLTGNRPANRKLHVEIQLIDGCQDNTCTLLRTHF